MARRIAAVTEARIMPPWKATPTDYAFGNARGLTDQQVAVLQRWVADGMLEGDRSKLPPLPTFTEGWQLGQPSLVVKMPDAFEVPPTGPDIYRSFVVPLHLETRASRQSASPGAKSPTTRWAASACRSSRRTAASCLNSSRRTRNTCAHRPSLASGSGGACGINNLRISRPTAPSADSPGRAG